MTDYVFDNPLWFAAGALVCIVAVFHPWILLATGAICGWKWWKKWRFKNMNLAEKKIILDTRGWSYLDIEKKKLMYLGTTEDGTIRWWFGNGDWIIPQAIDNGEFYWNKRVEIKNPVLLRHLKGFYEMGNEWPEYYKTVCKKEPTKKVYKKSKDKNHTWVDAAMIKHPTSFDPEVIKAVESDLPRADYTDAEPETKPATAAMASDAPLMELIKTVKDLETDATGSCPTIDFKGIST